MASCPIAASSGVCNILLGELKALVSADASEQQKWFCAVPVRQRLLENMATMYQKSYDCLCEREYQMILECAFSVCVYTAPCVLTMIAPPASYEKKVDAVPQFHMLGLHSEKIGEKYHADIEEFVEILRKPVADGCGFSVLCLLYDGRHGFLIEKRSDICCFLYQSYFNTYSFLEFLEDCQKQSVWTPEELIDAICGILCKEVPPTEKTARWGKLFFKQITFPFSDSQYPLRFLKTKSYQLKQS